MQTELEAGSPTVQSARIRGFYRQPSGEPTFFNQEDDSLLRDALADKDALLWVDLQISQFSDGRILTDVFGFHPLTIEDAVEPRVDPAKIEDYGEYIFIVMQALTTYIPNQQLAGVEVDFYLGPNYVVSCHQEPVPAIEGFLERCRKGDNITRRRADWVLHGLMDAIVDEYLPIVDAVDDTIDDLETRVLHRADRQLLEEILIVKRTTLRLRRATAPQRDLVNRLARGDFSRLVGADTVLYFRDVYDHLVRIEYLVEALRDLADGALQTYLSVVSNRLNEIVKVLTVGATIILPLTLISGIYGMNFEDNQFPSFGAPWGFATVVGSMIAIAVLMLAFFRLKRWI
jgi:magnesium transporter